MQNHSPPFCPPFTTDISFVLDRNRPVLLSEGNSSQQRSNSGDLTHQATLIQGFRKTSRAATSFQLTVLCFCVAAPPGDGDDYVADSEDEATKNFKGRVSISPKHFLLEASINACMSYIYVETYIQEAPQSLSSCL